MREISLASDWRSLNEQMAIKGEFLLVIGILRHWKKQLKKANREKRVRPCLYPDSFIKRQAVLSRLLSRIRRNSSPPEALAHDCSGR
ncbi:hypothetical protein [Tardisphaera saccharovorans]